jgi:glycosyltransferase involved in cell wall biosynthesis
VPQQRRAHAETGTGADDAAAAEAVAVAFVMPVYGHPVLMTEAMESVLAQEARVPFRLVVISDGCPLPETDLICASYALAHPQMIYLRKPNGGPSSARNAGIDYALASWPKLEAIFFIDADNRLAPTALADAWAALRANPEAGWIYTDIDSFGIDWHGRYQIPYSPLLHVAHDNICDTGSLVRRAVFEAGVRFDEDRRAGFEDWDFFLQALGAGFHGQPASFGFSYRQRPESRYRAMNRTREATLDYMRARHQTLTRPRTLMRFEHDRDPRYAFVTDDGAVQCFTDPDHRTFAIAPGEFARSVWAAIAEPDSEPLPAFFIWGSEEALNELATWKLLHGVLWLLERSCGEATLVALSLHSADGEITMSIARPDYPSELAGRAVLWVAASDEVKRLALAPQADLPGTGQDRLDAALEVTVRAPGLGGAPLALPVLWNSLSALRESPFATTEPKRWSWRPTQFPARDKYSGVLRNFLGAEAVMPRLAAGKPLEIGVVLPIASFGGAEKVSYAMSHNLREAGARVHLFVTGRAQIKLLSDFQACFDSVTLLTDPSFPLWGGPVTSFGQDFFMPDSPELKTERIVGMLAGLDVIINCHCAPLNSIIGTLRRQGARTANYLHVNDLSPLGRLAGHTYLAVAFEHGYDRIITCSNLLASELHALGVPADKLIPVANAASFTLDPVLAAAAAAARATPRGERPLRLLYMGRLDAQKGVERLHGLISTARERNLDIEFRCVGGTLIEDSADRWRLHFEALSVQVWPPEYNVIKLCEHYLWADVMLLPARWEGAPLVIAEAQALGCIPLCTDVGAVSELLTDGVDGLLVPNLDDEVTVQAMVAAIEGLLADDERRLALAQASLERAAKRSWAENFAPLRAWLGL